MTIPQQARPPREPRGVTRRDCAPDAARELAGWLLAVEHLHERGLPAAVPEFAATWLRRQGIRADWTYEAVA
jgi:hypothetical protein